MTRKQYELLERMNAARQRYSDAIEYIRLSKSFKARHLGAIALINAHNDLMKLGKKYQRYYK